MSARLEAQPLRDLDQLQGMRAEFEVLLAEADTDPLCNSPEWIEAYLQAWTSPGDVHGWAFREAAGELVGLALLRPEPGGGHALRRLCLAQDGSFDSDYLELPARPGRSLAVLEALFDAQRARGGAEALLFSGLPAAGPTHAAVRELAQRRALPLREVGVVGISSALKPDFETFLTGLAPRMRSMVRRALRDAHEHGLSLRWCESAQRLEADLGALAELHQARWQASGEAGSLADERRLSFYHTLALGALQRGQLRLAMLEREGQVVAAQFGVLARQRYYQLQEGYLPELAEQRVGLALRALAIGSLAAEGVQHYDFMAGDARHKRDWGGEPRECATVALGLGNLRSRAIYGVRAKLERLRGTRWKK